MLRLLIRFIFFYNALKILDSDNVSNWMKAMVFLTTIVIIISMFL